MANPAKKSAAVQEMEAAWSLAGALLGGTDAMRAAGARYLPKWPKEDDSDYAARLATAVCFPGFQRTITTLAGKPFSKPLTLGDDVPPQMREWLQNADLEGRNLHTFAADIMERALGYGLAGILVEFPTAAAVPRTEAGVTTVAAERAAGVRPYLVEVKASQILGWRARLQGGTWQLVQLRLMECVTEPDGEFDDVTVEQVRVLEPGRWATYRKADKAKDEWALYEEGATTLDFVPFVPVYGQRLGFMMGRPPLLELAHLNVAHWQSASDQQTILHVARVPILTVSGVDDDTWEFTVGASSAVKLPMNGKMEFVEHTGAAIEAGAKDLQSLEDRMRQAGAELLVIGQGATTRIEAASDNEVAMCALQRITLGVQDAMNLALEYMARWVRLPAGGSVTLFNDFGVNTLSEAMATLIKDMASAGLISNETAFEEQQRRGIISAERKWADEQARLDAQGPALGMIGDPALGGNGPPGNGNNQ